MSITRASESSDTADSVGEVDVGRPFSGGFVGAHFGILEPDLVFSFITGRGLSWSLSLSVLSSAVVSMGGVSVVVSVGVGVGLSTGVGVGVGLGMSRGTRLSSCVDIVLGVLAVVMAVVLIVGGWPDGEIVCGCRHEC